MTSLSNSQVFLNELSNIAASYLPSQSNSTIAAGIQVLENENVFSVLGPGTPIQDSGISKKLINFTSLNTTNVTSFLTNFYTQVLDYPPGVLPASTSSAYNPANPASPLYGLYTIFVYSLGYLNPSDPDLNVLNATNLPGQFNALFTNFIQNFNFSILSSSNTTGQVKSGGITYDTNILNNYDNFIQAYLSYLSSTTVVQSANKGGLQSFTQPLNVLPTNYLESYQAIYESFNGPVGTLSPNSANWTVAQKVFVQRLSSFYTSELRKTATSAQPSGFFDPSQDLSDWYNYTQSLYYNPQYSPNAIKTDPNSTFILDQVLQSLINMIGTVQNVAAAQANSLNFLSVWQESYTNKLNDIRTFAQGDGTVLGGQIASEDWDPGAQQQIRTQLNNVNQTYLTKIQANQQSISDNAKSLQSNVNQSSDSANEQGSLADSVLQEMSTILSSIFR